MPYVHFCGLFQIIPNIIYTQAAALNLMHGEEVFVAYGSVHEHEVIGDCWASASLFRDQTRQNLHRQFASSLAADHRPSNGPTTPTPVPRRPVPRTPTRISLHSTSTRTPDLITRFSALSTSSMSSPSSAHRPHSNSNPFEEESDSDLNDGVSRGTQAYYPVLPTPTRPTPDSRSPTIAMKELMQFLTECSILPHVRAGMLAAISLKNPEKALRLAAAHLNDIQQEILKEYLEGNT
jgi:hypothetical protein